MNDQDRAQKLLLERQLRDRAQALRIDLRREPEPRTDHAGVGGGILDQTAHAPGSAIHDLDRAAVARMLAEIRAIERTLQRIGHADFGMCVDCGEGIPFAQLRLNPMAERCSDCQTLRERLYADRQRSAHSP